MTDVNVNIKIVFIEQGTVDESTLKKLEKAGIEVVLTNKDELKAEIEDSGVHFFNCC